MTFIGVGRFGGGGRLGVVIFIIVSVIFFKNNGFFILVGDNGEGVVGAQFFARTNSGIITL